MITITKKQFEYYLFQYKKHGILFSYNLVDIENTYEYVYEIKLKGVYDTFYLYSSIDKSTDKSREYATDRLRLVRLKDGKYTRIARLNRVKNGI